MPAKKIDYKSGTVFQKFTLIEEDFEHKRKNSWERFFLCRCECGNIKSVRISHLKTGNTISCGCHRIANGKKKTTHGMFGTRFYAIWSGMKTRCYNKKTPPYKNYGGRGIFMCDKRLNFEGFYEDMYSSYKQDLSIERIDNNLGYSKENCKWATLEEQSRNKRGSVKYKGKCISERGEIAGIKANTIYKRHSKGWNLHDAIFTPLCK